MIFVSKSVQKHFGATLCKFVDNKKEHAKDLPALPVIYRC